MKVQVILKNNVQIDGIIDTYKNNRMIVKSVDGKLTTVIPSVSDSVVFYQVNSKEVHEFNTEKPRPTEHTTKKARRADPTFITGLRSLFKQNNR